MVIFHSYVKLPEGKDKLMDMNGMIFSQISYGPGSEANPGSWTGRGFRKSHGGSKTRIFG